MLADDHAIVRSGVRQMVDAQDDMRVVAEAGDGEEALRILATTGCDVLVQDLSLPGVSGMEIVQRARAVAPSAAIVILTMYPEDQLALHYLAAGAAAYLSKSRAPEELLAAIRKAAARGRYITDTLGEIAVMQPAAREKAPHDLLSPRELQVFLLLVQGRTVSEIAIELSLSSSTVSNHLARVRDKLGVSSNGEVLRYAHRAAILR
jgi:DNA-binding NarL/FixJ family response regulator